MSDVHMKLNQGLPQHKHHSTRRKLYSPAKLHSNLRNKLVMCYIWSTVLYGAETWKLWIVYQKNLESSELWCCWRMEINWTDHVKWRSITKSQSGQEYPTNDKTKEG